MAGRFPGAATVAEFWQNQIRGVEAISRFGIEDLEISKASAALADPNYVPARSVLNGVDSFDADFFGIYPREAELMDPQQRLFLESCWQTFEDAGYDPSTFSGSIGVYAGSSPSTYFLSRLCARPGFIEKFTNGYQVDNYVEMIGNSLDFLATRVSYVLNLRGPSFTILSACSTSLVAVTQACQSLLTYQCDMALAGGVSITLPQRRGTFYQEGGMVSPDGHCRAFDVAASGTVFGSGVATVLLKRLEDALRDNDQIYSVIRGFGVNNDGAAKVGYTAPSVEGQSRAIAMAQAAAGIEPDSIGYIEAHGTGTPLGDPIELSALTKVFRTQTSKKQYCVIGTAKTNVGHLDAAAGVTGLINATHIVRHGVFPPTLHFKAPNANFDLENSPFFVNTALSHWKPNGGPRRAGVSSFGVGGTNAHVVIEQAPDRQTTPSTKSAHLFVLSARTEAALDRATENLAAHLSAHPDINLADAAWTLQIGRREFAHRRAVAARNVKEAITALSSRVRPRAPVRSQPKGCPVGFLFPGQGSQHVNMGREIYRTEPVFRDAVDRCSNILRPHLGVDLRSLLYPADNATAADKRRVTDTVIAQPALFTIEYALAQLWKAWGVRPNAMLGHSIGEFVAACLAGVFDLDDALAVIAARGRMMQQLPPGGMLSVRLSEAELRRRLPGSLSIAAVNSPSLCVAAGPSNALGEFEQVLAREGIAVRPLTTSHAFHSAMMDPLIEPFTEIVAKVRLKPPQIPYVSSVTGTWITDREATDPRYWARHAREPVKFSSAVDELLKDPEAALVEVGPGNVLSTLARQHVAASADRTVVPSLSDEMSGRNDAVCLMNAVGSLWCAGAHLDWRAFHGEERRQRISLPTYSFESNRYWLELDTVPQLSAATPVATNSQSSSNAHEPAKAQEPTPMNDMSNASAAAPSAHGNREARIHAAVAEIFEDLSGMDFATVDRSTTFLELGFDSLFLTQVTQALQSKFGVKITLRQLLGEQSTLQALAQYLGDNAAPGLFDEPSPAVGAPVPAPSPVSQPLTIETRGTVSVPDSAAANSPLDQLMREQLRAMNMLFAQQLDAMRASSAASATQPPTSGAVRTEARPHSTIASDMSSDTLPPTTGLPANEGSKPHGPFRPVQKDASGTLSESQQKHLAAFIERHTKRTANSKRATQEFRKTLADPRAVSGFRAQWKELVYPIVTNRSQGSRLWDIDGNEYIDLTNGFGSIMLGHRPEFVEAAIAKQLHEGFEIGPQSRLAGEISRMFCEMTGNERMTFCNTGSEAVMAAMRVARTVTGRNKVVMFSGDYHGTFDEVLVKGFTNKAGDPISAPIAPGIPRENLS
ncbi:MAG TPA: aminotransferase class III-fold pyridoxal phosphate-dependent enzyme, partial [Lacipirellulaceae bacterium]|nr:aminotransferase class III-fold pyridoxal phosphate-dependent enzyme [Lacipirellulaceae bacterium]